MRKKILYLLLLVLFLGIAGCSNDDNDNASKNITIMLNDSYDATASKVLKIVPEITEANVTYKWLLLQDPQETLIDSILSTNSILSFIALKEGAYHIALKVSKGTDTGSKEFIINVKRETKQYSPYITAIYDFEPAPGTMTNECYKKDEATKEEVMQIALGRINNTSVGYLLDLGSFGGSIVVGFDHTVKNVHGERDFRVYGVNEYQYSTVTAPGLLFVAYDENGNGIPDDDEWYEIKGSAHDKNIVTENLSITYNRPTANKKPIQIGGFDSFYDRESVFCETSLGESFYMALLKNRKELCPSWIDQNELTYIGKNFTINLEAQNAGQYTVWNYDVFEWGYANAEDPDIDIDWAVDKNGNKVNLPGVDFIKVVNCVNANDKMIYSTVSTTPTTKFAGAADLHILEKYNLKRSEK